VLIGIVVMIPLKLRGPGNSATSFLMNALTLETGYGWWKLISFAYLLTKRPPFRMGAWWLKSYGIHLFNCLSDLQCGRLESWLTGVLL